MEPGIYYDLPSHEYHTLAACSNSRLSDMRRSAAYCRYCMTTPKKATAPMLLGSAVHMAILEPDRFEQTYVCLSEGCDRRTKAGKDEYADKITNYPPESILGYDEYQQCIGMRDAVRGDNQVSARALAACENTEVSVIWRHEGTGLLCKSRPDAISASKGIVVDLKTTDDASPEAFSRKIAGFGYHRQSAFYLDALASVGFDVRFYAIVAVESKPPYQAAVYELEPAAIEAGRYEYTRLIERYAECVETGAWPGYGNGRVITIGLPAWAEREIFNEAA